MGSIQRGLARCLTHRRTTEPDSSSWPSQIGFLSLGVGLICILLCQSSECWRKALGMGRRIYVLVHTVQTVRYPAIASNSVRIQTRRFAMRFA